MDRLDELRAGNVRLARIKEKKIKADNRTLRKAIKMRGTRIERLEKKIRKNTIILHAIQKARNIDEKRLETN